MNRRMQWTQEPPNFDDYAPECLEGKMPVQLQTAPPPSLEAKGGKGGKGSPPVQVAKVTPNKRGQMVSPAPSYQEAQSAQEGWVGECSYAHTYF